MGWLAPVLGLTLAGVFAWRTFPLERKSAPTLRSAALVGALLFAFHGLFDVSGHRLGSAIPGLMLFGIAARIPWTAAPSSVQPWIARAGASLVGIIGIAWGLATSNDWVWPGSVGVKILNTRARAFNEADHFEEAIREMDRAVELAALDWQNYFLRGVAYTFSNQPAEAERDFRRARRLEPSIASAPYEEGRMWLYFDPARAKDAWSEALRREPQKNVVYFRRMLADVGNRTGLRVMMRELAGDRTDLLIEWLLTSSPEEFRTELNRLKAVDGYSSWNSNQLVSLFSAWLRSGNPAELIQAMEANPEWNAVGWKQLAAAYAAQKDLQRACQTVRRFQPAPALPDLPERSEVEASREFARSPRDFISGYQLYRAQARSGDWSGALETLDRLAALSDAPSYLASLRADALEHLNRWPEAWNILSHTLQ
jgi:Flp pilus assembly protein TadD